MVGPVPPLMGTALGVGLTSSLPLAILARPSTLPQTSSGVRDSARPAVHPS
jgi:hypothetical protein